MFNFLASYAVEVGLIPRAKETKCPGNTKYKGGIGTCSCEDHCGWELCRLAVAPRECIAGTHSEWQWDHEKNAWVAQVITGNLASIMTIFPTKFYN